MPRGGQFCRTPMQSPERRQVMERIVRAVNLVSWLSPEAVKGLEDIRDASIAMHDIAESMRAALEVTA